MPVEEICTHVDQHSRKMRVREQFINTNWCHSSGRFRILKALLFRVAFFQLSFFCVCVQIFFSRLSPSSKRARALKPAPSNGAQNALLSLRQRSQSHDRFTTSHVYWTSAWACQSQSDQSIKQIKSSPQSHLLKIESSPVAMYRCSSVCYLYLRDAHFECNCFIVPLTFYCQVLFAKFLVQNECNIALITWLQFVNLPNW